MKNKEPRQDQGPVEWLAWGKIAGAADAKISAPFRADSGDSEAFAKGYQIGWDQEKHNHNYLYVAAEFHYRLGWNDAYSREKNNSLFFEKKFGVGVAFRYECGYNAAVAINDHVYKGSKKSCPLK